MRRHLVASLLMLLVVTLAFGFAYPFVVTGLSQLFFHQQANGSLIYRNGKLAGSSLLGQEFTDAKGNPLAQYFQPRPSNARISSTQSAGSTGDYGCDPAQSAGSNLGPNSDKLAGNIAALRKSMAAFDSVDGYTVSAEQVATDAVTASGSGLDPQISVLNAQQQEHRIAATRGISVAQVDALVKANTGGRDLGILGEPGVNVLQLNLALDAQYPYSAK